MSRDQIPEALIQKLTHRYPEISQLVKSENCIRYLTEYTEKVITRLIPVAAFRIGIDDQCLSERYEGVSVIDNPAVNATVCFGTNSKKTFKIIIYRGLLEAFSVFPIILVWSARQTDDKEMLPLDPMELIQLEPVVTSDAMKAFWEGRWPLVNPALVAQAMVELSDQDLTYACHLNDAAVSFVLAHELGHVAINMSAKGRNPELSTAICVMEQLLSNTTSLSNQKRNERVIKWAKELAADFIGLNLVPASYGTYNSKTRSFTLSNLCHVYFPSGASKIALLFNNMLINFFEQTTRTAPEASHPPAWLRLAYLRSSLEFRGMITTIPENSDEVANAILREAGMDTL